MHFYCTFELTTLTEREWKATGEEKLTIIFNNLEKWQIAAVGPQFAKIACRVYVTRMFLFSISALFQSYYTGRLINQNDLRHYTSSSISTPLSHRPMSPILSPSQFTLSSPIFSARKKGDLQRRGSSLPDSLLLAKDLSVSDFVMIDDKSHKKKLREKLDEKLKEKSSATEESKGESEKGDLDSNVEEVIAEFYNSVEEIMERLVDFSSVFKANFFSL